MRSSFGRGFFKIKGGKRTASAPNLGETIFLLDKYVLGLLKFHCDQESTNNFGKTVLFVCTVADKRLDIQTFDF